MPSLKAMQLLSVKFSGGESVDSLLRICPVLEGLVVNQTEVFDSNECTMSSCGKLKTLTLSELSIKVVLPWFRLPSLKSLHLLSVKFSGEESIARFLQICPVLEYLVVDQTEDDSVMLEDVPVWFCLPSLKSLHLLSVNFSGDESFSKLIQRCPVLEDLVINKTRDDNVMIFNINAPSLRSLSIDNSIGKRAYVEENHGFVINAPSLEKMDFKDTFSNFLVFEHMPEVTEANIQVLCGQSENFIGSLTSIRHLSLCSLSSETPYPSGITFPYLEHLELSTCSDEWSNLLVCLLYEAPTLKYLKLKSQHGAHYNDPLILWKEPTSVPECLSTHLEIVEWRQYEGKEHERNMAAYILANATCLKTATFSIRCGYKHHNVLRKLKNLNRVSETYQTEDDSVMLEDVPVWFCLPSLKSLHLLSVNFSGDESFSKLIQRCPVSEDLVINKTRDDNVTIFNINAPSLRSLSIDNSTGERTYVEENHGFVINAPSLEKMNFKDTFSNCLVFEHMPEVIEANIHVICGQPENFIGSLTSICHLSLCSLSSETPYPSGTTFPYLEHLELCTRCAGWANLLQHGAHYNDQMILWKEPTAVPECLSTHLEIMEWRQYEGTEQERSMAAYILANATCLKTATFSTRCGDKHHNMLRKLKNLNRVSETSQLLFD
ncbi:hypothetical protein F2Q68_00000921 [Brassica cretica]|uniref:FBD domain-containing protein n=1 Tax=Brassica cretica TaxID=69181 RepID=A0A8S9JBB3_BRACR|nr:hypothetical protein F2Q68_00000921 [Brassica cretica]